MNQLENKRGWKCILMKFGKVDERDIKDIKANMCAILLLLRSPDQKFNLQTGKKRKEKNEMKKNICVKNVGSDKCRELFSAQQMSARSVCVCVLLLRWFPHTAWCTVS